MPTSKKSTERWVETIAKAEWSARESSKEWPSPLDSEDDSPTEDVSGRNIQYNFNPKKPKEKNIISSTLIYLHFSLTI